jgi:hypothetical protein
MLKLGRAVVAMADFLETYHYRIRTQENKKWQSPETEMPLKSRLPNATATLGKELPKTLIVQGLAAVCHFFNLKRIGESYFVDAL